MDRIGVIVPVYRPDKKLDQLMEQLFRQTRVPDKILLMLTLCDETKEQEEKEALLERVEQAKWEIETEVLVMTLTKAEFNHGKTRQQGMEACDTDYVVCMTQDAVPKDKRTIEELYSALKRHPEASHAYGRQMVDKHADTLTVLTQNFNYPDVELVKSRDSYEAMGIKTIFCSDVCCMYDRKVFLELGGFELHVIFNEDMMFARKAIDAGYQIVYAANARVIHWHNYNMLQQFHRNFDNGVSQAEHPEVFADLPAENEGIKMVKKNLAILLKKGKVFSAVRYFFQSGAKFLGFRFGKMYKKLPKWLVLRFTMTPSYFK